MPPAMDKKVPDFAAEATCGPVKLSSLKGSKVVLYFYPKDNTPGCTTEGSDFAAAHRMFDKAGAVILGVSRDSLKSHDGFKVKMKFPFELISDPEEALCNQFGVMKMKNMYGVEFLLWLPESGEFATFFMGTASARFESPKLRALVGKAANLASKKITKGAYTWFAPKCSICLNDSLDMPAKEALIEEIKAFNNPPKTIESDPNRNVPAEDKRG